MLRNCDAQVARAHHCNNEENMLIADSSAGRKIKQSKQHLRCSLLLNGRDGQERRQSEVEAERDGWVGWREEVLPEIRNELFHVKSQTLDTVNKQLIPP